MTTLFWAAIERPQFVEVNCSSNVLFYLCAEKYSYFIFVKSKWVFFFFKKMNGPSGQEVWLNTAKQKKMDGKLTEQVE